MSDYTFTWGNNPKRATLKGRRCRVIARGRMRSCLVEFENGQREVVSMRALRTQSALTERGAELRGPIGGIVSVSAITSRSVSPGSAQGQA
jgi:hypothetical protein